MFAELVAAVRRTELMLGSADKTVAECEGTIGRSCVAARDLPAGHELTAADIAFKRPGSGVRPYAAATLLGRRLRSTVRQDQLLDPAQLA
jgi:N-acetylneuraminate synthase